MARTYKNAKAALTTSNATIVTAGAGETLLILSAQITNIDGTNEADATLSWTDSSDSDTETALCSAATVAAKDAIDGISGTQVLETGDALKGLASANGDLVVTVSYVVVT